MTYIVLNSAAPWSSVDRFKLPPKHAKSSICIIMSSNDPCGELKSFPQSSQVKSYSDSMARAEGHVRIIDRGYASVTGTWCHGTSSHLSRSGRAVLGDCARSSRSNSIDDGRSLDHPHGPWPPRLPSFQVDGCLLHKASTSQRINKPFHC